MSDERLVGVVLAGGASRRFGSDKLAATLAGRPLVLHAVDALRRVPVDEVVVVGPPEPAMPAWLTEVTASGARLVRDDEPFGGPLVGIASALRVLDAADLALVVGGDMPWLEPAVLAALARAARSSDAVVACLVTEGRDQPIPIALRVGPASAAAARLLAEGRRRLGVLLEADPGRVRLPVDPRLVRDVDTPADMQPAGADEAPAGGSDGRGVSGRGTDTRRAGA